MLDDWRDVVARAVADAKKGDHQARAWLTKYLVGERAKLSDVDTDVDQSEPIRLTDAERQRLIEKIMEEAGYVDDEDGGEDEQECRSACSKPGGRWRCPINLLVHGFMGL